MSKGAFRFLSQSLTALFVGVFFFSGCNFFGKKDPDEEKRAVGELQNGTSILGTWSFTSVSLNSNNQLNSAVETVLEFDPSGTARVTFKNLFKSGSECKITGAFRSVSSNDFIFYAQSIVGSGCGISQMLFTQVEVKGGLFKYRDPDSGQFYSFFKVRPQVGAPVGAWAFDFAQSRLDYMILDPNGYFIIVTHTSAGEYYPLIGRYLVSNGSLSFYFFTRMDPASEDPVPLIYNSFYTNGIELGLIQVVDDNEVVSIGQRL